jgi:hypothetical protein
LLRRDGRTQITRVTGEEKYLRIASRSVRAFGLGSNDVPRSAFSAGIEALTVMVAEPSSERNMSSSYSYWRNRFVPQATLAADDSTQRAQTARDHARIHICANVIVKSSCSI